MPSHTFAILSFGLALAASALAQSPLQSTFVGGLQLSTTPPPATALFDINVVDPAGIVIRQIDCNTNTNAGTNATLGVWITGVGGTLVGNELNAAAWTQVATATRTHTGGRVAFTLPTPFYLAPGTYGMALHHVGANPVYTNPATPVPPLPSSYSTLEATLNMASARVRGSTATLPFGGAGLGNLCHPNVALFYVSGSVYADFVGTPIRGTSPLTVNFTSFATSGNPGGILNYLWDFEADGTIESTLPNPTFTYTTCGNYSVRLTIIDAVGPTVVTKAAYVQTDLVVPGFTNQLIAPLTVQFTDTSSPVPTAWAWDLDGDGLTDSTQQNPVWVYPNGCSEVNVRLSASRACQPAIVLQKRVAVATTLETTFQSGLIISAAAAGGATFVDANVLNPLGITVCGMHVNSNVAAGSPVTLNVYQKTGTYVGSVETAANWRLVGTATATSTGQGNRTFVSFPAAIHLATGINGLAIEHVGASPVYTNLGGVQTFANADVALTAGLIQLSPVFGPAATSTQFTPRIANLALHYGTTQSNGAAGYGYIGAGCAGTLGIPGNKATTPPVLGGTCTLVVDKLPFDLGVMALGVSNTISGIGPLPVDLTFLGMPGCPLRVSFEATATLLGAGNTASLAFPIPATAAFVGVQVYSQALSLDPLLNGFGFAISDAAVLLVGS